MKLLNFDDIQSTYYTQLRDCNGTMEKGIGGLNLSTTMLCPEPYIVHSPLAFRGCPLTYHIFCKKNTKTKILSYIQNNGLLVIVYN